MLIIAKITPKKIAIKNCFLNGLAKTNILFTMATCSLTGIDFNHSDLFSSTSSHPLQACLLVVGDRTYLDTSRQFLLILDDFLVQ